MAKRAINPVPQEYRDGLPLDGAKLFYFKSGTNDDLATFADELKEIPNTQPVVVDAQGRWPNIFFDGSAKLVLKDKNDVTIYERDPVSGEIGTGPFDVFSTLVIYDLGDIVTGSNGKIFVSLVNANQGNDPVTPSPGFWTEWRLRRIFNASESYIIADVVQDSVGDLYKSLVTPNLGNTPSSSPTKWVPAVAGSKIAEVTTLETRTTTVLPKIGAVALVALRINELQDNGPFSLPLANSVLANQTITLDFPDTFAAFEPVVNRSGTDTITNNAGSDTSITFLGPTRVIAVSNGVDTWRL